MKNKSYYLILLLIIILSCALYQTVPDKPLISYSVPFGYPDSTYIFVAYCCDDDADSVRIKFAWGDSTESEWSELVPSGVEVSMEHSYSIIDTYYIKVLGMDEDSNISAWSDEKPIVIDTIEHYVTEDTLIEEWTYDITDAIGNSNYSMYAHCPAIGYDGTIYVTAGSGTISGDSYLIALNSNGILKWTYNIENGSPSDPIIGPSGVIYIGGPGILAINADGTLNWQWNEGHYPIRVIVDDNENIYALIQSSDNTYEQLIAFSSSGNIQWQSDTFRVGEESYMAKDNDRIYISIDADSFYCIDASNGQKMWTFPIAIYNAGPIIVDDDGVFYWVQGNDTLNAIDSTGVSQWKIGEIGGFTRYLSNPSLGTFEKLYLFASGKGLIAIDTRDGSTVWTQENSLGFSSMSTISYNEDIFVALNDGFYGFDVDGNQIYYYENLMPVGSPAIASDGTIYICDDDYLTALSGGASGLASSPWPRAYRNNFNRASR